MSIITKNNLLVDYALFKSWNGFQLPQINDEDIANGLTTPELKYGKWAFYTQTILNAILQEELDNIKYDLNAVKPAYQTSLINIICTRLNRAFYNDQLLQRDSQVMFNQQGGIQYSSNAASESKSSLWSFFNADERALIESSGIMEDVFTFTPDTTTDNLESNKFLSGEIVPNVDLREFQRVAITFNGVTTTIPNALELLRAGKVDSATLTTAILDATGLSTSSVDDRITVALNKFIIYSAFRTNKSDNELAQMKDVKDSEARSRADISIIKKKISSIESTDAFQNQQLGILTQLVLLLGEENIFVPTSPIALAGTGTTATKDLKTILIPDPLNPSQNIQKYTDFSDTGKWEFDFIDEAPEPDHYGATRQFLRTQSGTLSISGSQATVSISNNGILTVTRTSGTLAIDTLKIYRIIFNGSGAKVGDTQVLADEVKQKVSKKLVQNNPNGFSSFADLKTKIVLGDFVNLLFASGQQVYGTVTDAAVTNANDPISIFGNLYNSNQDIQSGLISIDSSFTITAINKFASETYVDAKFAQIPENIDATVAGNVAGPVGNQSLYIQSNVEIQNSNLNSEIKMDILPGSGNLADVAGNKIILIQEPDNTFIPLIASAGATTGVLFSATLAGTTKTISDIVTGNDILVLKKVSATFKPGGSEPYNYLIVKIESSNIPTWKTINQTTRVFTNNDIGKKVRITIDRSGESEIFTFLLDYALGHYRAFKFFGHTLYASWVKDNTEGNLLTASGQGAPQPTQILKYEIEEV